MLCNHLIFCCSLLLLSSVFPSIRVFSNESAPLIKRPKYWSFTLNISSVQSLSCVRLFATPWTAARHPPLSSTVSWSLLKFMSIESVMLSNHRLICRPLLLLPSICPSFRVFSDESTLFIRWAKCWSFSFSISPSSEYSGLISFRMDCR